MTELIYNAIQTPDGTVIQSTNRHDFVSYKDENGQFYAVDGGLEYARRAFDKADYKELSLYDDEPHTVQRDVLKWGTMGPDGNGPLEYKKISEMSNEHIEAVLETQPRIRPVIKRCLQEELEYRKAYPELKILEGDNGQ